MMYPIRIIHKDGRIEDRYVERLVPTIQLHEMSRLRLTLSPDEEDDINLRTLVARRQLDMATRLPTYIIE